MKPVPLNIVNNHDSECEVCLVTQYGMFALIVPECDQLRQNILVNSTMEHKVTSRNTQNNLKQYLNSKYPQKTF